MITFTKEQLIASAQARIEFAEMMLSGELEPLKERTWSIELELARITLASLEAERVGCDACGGNGSVDIDHSEMGIEHIECQKCYTAPPAPVSVPDLTALDNLAGEMLNHAMNCERRVAVAYTHCAHRLAEEVRDLRAAMLQGAEPVTTAYKLTNEIGSSLQLRNLIRQRHAEWSQATFGDVGPVGPLKHLSKEALEAAAEPNDLSEWADMQFLLWDAQRRAGISDGEITAAMEEKLKVNMARQWPEPKDGEPRLHIKTAPQQEVK